MTDKQTTEYLEQLGAIQLSSDVKTSMREELSAFADFYTVTASAGASARPVGGNFFMLFTRQMQTTIATLVLIIGTGGVSLAAQGTLPGDYLYPVKVNVNEQIQASFVFDADAQAQLQAERFASRIDEARSLVLQGNKDKATSEAVRLQIDKQREKTLKAASLASAETEVAVRTEVADVFLAAQRMLTSPRVALASASRMASVPAQGKMFSDDSSFSATAESSADMGIPAFDTRITPMQVPVDVYEQGSDTDSLYERVDTLQIALAETTDIGEETRYAIGFDLARARGYLDEYRIFDAVNLVEYIESFLGVPSQYSEPDIYALPPDIDVMPVKPSMEPMSIDGSFGGGTDAGFGFSGNSGNDIDIYSDPMIEDVSEPSFGSEVIDMPLYREE